MKKTSVLFLIVMTLFACKNEAKPEVDLEDNRAKSYDANDGYITMKGEFVYDAENKAAVLQLNNEIYGVVVDDNMHKLNEKVKPFKENVYTSVPVTVRVNRITNTNTDLLWKDILEIKEILKVEAPDPNKEDVIKLGN